MSAGWGRKFNLQKAGNIELMFDLRMAMPRGTDLNDNLLAVVSIDSKDIVPSLEKKISARLQGVNEGGYQYLGFTKVTVNLGNLSAGRHKIVIGGYLSKKENKNEKGLVYI